MESGIELRHLRYFVAVAELLHFGRAAHRLHLAQPALSQQIRKLEEIVGSPLFNRTSRSVSLTAAGQVLMESARRNLRTVQRDLEDASSVGRGEVGSLDIGFVGSSVLTFLPAVLRAYREAYPRVKLRLHESFTSLVVEGLENGSLDAGILRDADPVKSLRIKAVFAEPFVAVLPATHPRARQKSVSPAMLRDEPFIYYPRSAGARAFDKPFSIFEAFGFRPEIVQEASQWLTIMRLVGVGLGITVAPECVRRIASPEVVCVNLRGSNVVSNLELARIAGDTRPIVERFAQVVERV